jgi:hypothetical protein
MYEPIGRCSVYDFPEEFKQQLEERLLNFAVAMVKMSTVRQSRRLLLAELPRNTAPYSNYAEAKFAVSR